MKTRHQNTMHTALIFIDRRQYADVNPQDALFALLVLLHWVDRKYTVRCRDLVHGSLDHDYGERLRSRTQSILIALRQLDASPSYLFSSVGVEHYRSILGDQLYHFLFTPIKVSYSDVLTDYGGVLDQFHAYFSWLASNSHRPLPWLDQVRAALSRVEVDPCAIPI